MADISYNPNIRYRVMNKTRYIIGVQLANGTRIQIQPGSFQYLTVDDILYIESICTYVKYFSKKLLVPVDTNGKEVPIEQITTYIETDPSPHLDDAGIEAMLKQAPKKIKAWLENVNDPAELHAIYTVAKGMDLSSTRLKVLVDKMPYYDFLENEEE